MGSVEGPHGHDNAMPIAVVGMSFRGPGDAQDIESFWKLLHEKRETWSPVPEHKWSKDAYYHPDAIHNGTSHVKGGHFIKQDLAGFDAKFFNMGAQEAACLDPQQRLLLECCYESFESAGIPLAKARGSNTSVFIGSFSTDYTELLYRDPETMPMYQATNSGNSRALLSNRLSYFYDFKGPSITIDTACSASMVAFHLACQSLRSKDADQAVVGGSSIILSPDLQISMSAMGFLSPDGRCYTFSDQAAGYGRSEGAGCILLKPLEAALRDGDPIRAVVRGTSSNQDGKTPGISFPSQEAQEHVISRTFSNFGIHPTMVGYHELHGTGTAAGDPVEAAALHTTLSQHRSPNDPLRIGSVKTNVGHMEAASGIASLIKSILMLEREVILPSINHVTPNPKIPLKDWNLKFCTELEPWGGQPKVLSVCGFGYGGSNAHACLEQASSFLKARGFDPSTLLMKARGMPQTVQETTKQIRIFPFSAASEDGIKRQSQALAQYLAPARQDWPYWTALSHTLVSRRSQLGWSAVVAADSPASLREKLLGGSYTTQRTSKSCNLAFVFTGQGAQYAGFGKELLQIPHFRKTLEKMSSLVKGFGADWDVIEELSKDAATSRVNEALFSQPLCSAVQIALVDLLAQWDVRPTAVVGHSSGEIAAAYAAGAMTMADAMSAAYFRGIAAQKMADAPVSGRMMAVGMSAVQIQPTLDELTQGRVVVACENSPVSTTCSGDVAAIQELSEKLDAAGVFNRKLAVDVAYHSHHMNYISDDYSANIPKLTPRESTVKFFSSVYGKRVETSQLGSQYWVDNMLGRVRFSEASLELLKEETDLMLEIGPHSALAGPLKQIFQVAKRKPQYVSALIRKQNALTTLYDTVCTLHLAGASISLNKVNDQHLHPSEVLTDLPSYQWDKTSKFWAESRVSKSRSNRAPRHDILGFQDVNFNPFEPQWRNIIRPSELPWVQDHKIQQNVIWPAAGYIAMVMQACELESKRRNIAADSFVIRDMTISQALIIPEDGQAETIFSLRPQSEGTQMLSSVWYEFKIYSVLKDDAWTQHCRGLCRIEGAAQTNAVDDKAAVTQSSAPKCGHAVEVAQLYESLCNSGLDYGETFRNVTALKTGDDVASGTLRVPKTTASMPSGHANPVIIHPGTLDASFHTIFAAMDSSLAIRPMVPSFIKNLRVANRPSLSQEGHELQVTTTTRKPDPRHVDAALTIMDDETTLVKIEGLMLTELPSEDDAEEVETSSNIVHCIEWKPHPDLSSSTRTSSVTSPPIDLQHPPEQQGIDLEQLSKVLQDVEGMEAVRASPFGLQLEQLEAQAFLNPDMKILEIGSQAGRATIPALRLLMDKNSGQPLFRSYEIVCQNAALVDAIKLRLPSVNELFKSVEQPAIDEYDAVIVTGESDMIQFKETTKVIRLPIMNVDSTEKALFGQLPGWLDTCPQWEDSKPMDSPAMDADEGSSDISDSRLANPADEVVVIGTGRIATTVVELLSEAGVEVSQQNIAITDFEKKTVICMAELESSILSTPDEVTFTMIKNMLLHSKACMWITRGAFEQSPGLSLATGLLRSARSENGGGRLTTLDLDAATQLNDVAAAQIIIELLKHQQSVEDVASADADVEYREVDGQLCIPRVVPDASCNTALSEIAAPVEEETREPFEQKEHVLTLEVGTAGLLDGIHYRKDGAMPDTIGQDEVEIEVMASGINFRDVMMTMGQIAAEALGAECSGVISRKGDAVTHLRIGDRVACVQLGSFANRIRKPASAVQVFPQDMSFSTAAAIPVAYCTAQYALHHVGRLQKGESILIHAASGGLGQAAVQLSLEIGATVYATVGSIDKKRFLMERYGLPSGNIFYSRGESFVSQVMQCTDGRGVDVVLNSVAGEALRQTWHCIGAFGRFLEVGKRDFFVNTYLEMSRFAKNVSFSAVDLVGLVRERPVLADQVWHEVMDMFKIGSVQAPNPVVEYGFGDVSSALRMMQSGKHIGKLVAVRKEGQLVKVHHTKIRQPLKLHNDASYVIVGGLGGIGRSLATWLASHGARNLILLSRSGATKPEAKTSIEALEAEGIRVHAPCCDVANERAVEDAFSVVADGSFPPVRGVIQAAMVLKDGMLADMALADYSAVLSAKVQGTWNVHNVLQDQQLDFFVMLSSISGIIGNPSQSNYAAANAFLDSFASYRRSNGQPAVSINLGAVGDVGYIAENASVAEAMRRQGFELLSTPVLHRLLECAMQGEDISTHQLITGMGTWKEGVSASSYDAALFSHFRRASRANISSAASGKGEASTRERLRKAANEDEAVEIIETALIAKVAELAMITASDVIPTKSIPDYGIDSLVAVELRNAIFREMGFRIPILDLLSKSSIKDTARKIGKQAGSS